MPPARVTGLVSAAPLPAGLVASLSMLSSHGSPVLGLKPLVKIQGPPLGSAPSWVALSPATLTAQIRFLVSTTRSVSGRFGSKAQPTASTLSSPVRWWMSMTLVVPSVGE